MTQFGSKPGLVKLYLRIGEVAELVGVQPHVLRYWETEFRGAIRPQKSKKGQRVYSRQDVERLLRVKDLLRNQGFTIAGARKVLREGVSRESALREGLGSKNEASPATAAQAAAAPEVVRSLTPLRPVAPVALAPTVAVPAAPAPVATPAVVWAASEDVTGQAEHAVAPEVQALASSAPKSDLAAIAERAPMFELVLPSMPGSDRSAKRLRRALVDLRQEVVSALKELT